MLWACLCNSDCITYVTCVLYADDVLICQRIAVHMHRVTLCNISVFPEGQKCISYRHTFLCDAVVLLVMSNVQMLSSCNSKTTTDLQKAHEVEQQSSRGNPDFVDRVKLLEKEVTFYKEESGKSQAEVERLLEILREVETEKNDKDKKIAELERYSIPSVSHSVFLLGISGMSTVVPGAEKLNLMVLP